MEKKGKKRHIKVADYEHSANHTYSTDTFVIMFTQEGKSLWLNQKQVLYL